ncbi:MAG: hypothetical protein QOF96_670 [Actinomycetota bacterium]|nr:hypothetical protein [Actinomycetota bacterium]
MRSCRTTLAAVVVGAALATMAGTGGARAADDPPRLAGRAEAKVLSASLFGRPIDFGASRAESVWRDGRPAVTAEGLGTSALADQTRSAATLDAPGAGGRRCATPPAGLPAVPGAGPAGPTLDVGLTCGEASATGDAGTFRAAASGGGTSLGIAAPAVLRAAVATLRSGLDPAVLPLGLGALVAPESGDPARSTAGRLDGLLGALIPGVGVGGLLPSQTVGGLLDELGKGELARITFGTSTSSTRHDPGGDLSEALSHGGVIDLLPGLLGSGGGPLVRVSVADSDASVRIDSGADHAVARVTDPVVRIESSVLDHLGLAGLAGMVPATKAAAPAAGVIELGPGQRLSLLCQGPLSPLCTEIAVAPAQSPTSTADGRTSVSAATVSVRLLQVPAGLLPAPGTGLDVSAPLATAGTALDRPAVTGLGVGGADPTGGIELVVGAARAEAGPRLVAGAARAAAGTSAAGGRITAAGLDAGPPAQAPADGRAGSVAAERRGAQAASLPRTGGVPFPPALVPLALLGSVGLAGGRRLFLSRPV